MSGFDRGSVYSHEVLPAADEATRRHEETREKFVRFIREYRVNNNFIYRDQLRQNVNTNQNFLDVDLGDLIAFDNSLANQLTNQPSELLPLFESAVQTVTLQLQRATGEAADPLDRAGDIQVLLRSNSNLILIRNLTSDHITKLVRVPGIVIAANNVVAKATSLHCMCSNCGHKIDLAVKPGMSGVQLPRVCPKVQTEVNKNKKCPLDPFQIVPDKSKYVDQQNLKLQEAPDMVPVGELPRSMTVTTDRYLTNRAVPGTRVTLIGIYSIFQARSAKQKGVSGVAVRHPYLRVIGMQVDTEGAGRGSKKNFTPEEEAAMIALSRSGNIFERFANSIAPSIFGSPDIKKAVTCLLLGGSRKVLPDGMRLRGDINVLLLGDPGTAKSQMLKFVEKVAPIGLYTSGKGSSAAGLTASVVRESGSRDFYLEGGAMVLADGGVVCIDEFDKMREEDRVAIHEAMEQQTISIAKAGITTILNTRTSVLAAANPVFGRYDDMKSPGENIEFQSTILSRFDMIFIVKDEHNEINDARLARHVMGVHMNAAMQAISSVQEPGADLDIQTMKNYISYCKSRCGPRLSPEAADRLSNYFVTIRSDVRLKEVDEEKRSSIPITIRQLEAIVRIAESLAKIGLQPLTTEQHVEEAIRLFRVSTMAAVDSGQIIEGVGRHEMMHDVEGVENEIRRRLPVGSIVSEKRLAQELTNKYPAYAVDKAIQLLLRREDLQHRNQGRSIMRMR